MTTAGLKDIVHGIGRLAVNKHHPIIIMPVAPRLSTISVVPEPKGKDYVKPEGDRPRYAYPYHPRCSLKPPRGGPPKACQRPSLAV